MDSLSLIGIVSLLAMQLGRNYNWPFVCLLYLYLHVLSSYYSSKCVAFRGSPYQQANLHIFTEPPTDTCRWTAGSLWDPGTSRDSASQRGPTRTSRENVPKTCTFLPSHFVRLIRPIHKNPRQIVFTHAGKLTGMVTKTDVVALLTSHFPHAAALAERSESWYHWTLLQVEWTMYFIYLGYLRRCHAI